MTETEGLITCISCGELGNGKHCNRCGQAYVVNRITLQSISHEVFHFFTHLDKGFPFTLKKLITSPGAMQREYIAGNRSRHQKPFSMFFICATISALMIYWINMALINYYDAGDQSEAQFFNRYWVLLQIVMLPVYSFITWLFFRRSGYNFAEIIVFQLYIFSVLFLVVASTHLIKFLIPSFQTRYIELPLIILYTMFANIRFFTNEKRGIVIIKGILAIGLNFAIASTVQDFLEKIVN
ncbi:MAG: DUF3667 domain-containing protein [Chitinophagaceae bacterium]|nr:DUF3667 domain-containing protein [Chitinophagaceae bacterium]